MTESKTEKSWSKIFLVMLIAAVSAGITVYLFQMLALGEVNLVTIVAVAVGVGAGTGVSRYLKSRPDS